MFQIQACKIFFQSTVFSILKDVSMFGVKDWLADKEGAARYLYFQLFASRFCDNLLLKLFFNAMALWVEVCPSQTVPLSFLKINISNPKPLFRCPLIFWKQKTYKSLTINLRELTQTWKKRSKFGLLRPPFYSWLRPKYCRPLPCSPFVNFSVPERHSCTCWRVCRPPHSAPQFCRADTWSACRISAGTSRARHSPQS